MYRRHKAWAIGPLFLMLIIALSAGCASSELQATPAPLQEPPASPTVEEIATATETAPFTATPEDSLATPTTSGEPETDEVNEEVAYELPVKGDPNASVTIIEFSDYL